MDDGKMVLRIVNPDESSGQFHQGMVDRMDISFFKYGAVRDAYPAKVDAIGSMRDRLQLYINGGTVKGQRVEPGNTEYLMDVANFAMIEFMTPRHPQAFFKPTDDSESPGRRSLDTGRQDARDNANIGSRSIAVPGAT